MTEIPLDPSWAWASLPWGRALRCRPLGEAAEHLFTTRAPALKAGTADAPEGWQLLARAFRVPPEAIVRLEQVHGRHVLVADGDGPPPGSTRAWGVGDAVVTRSPHLALTVRVADCVPILMADRATGAVAAVHAGWRGTCAGVAGAAVEALGSEFGTDPADLVVAIGPSIGPCCYRVGPDVEAAFRAVASWQAHVDRWLTAAPARQARQGIPGPRPEGRPSRFLDTWTANADQFEAAGVPRDRIHASNLCTSCHREVFHSYRVDGSRAGRMVGAIRVRGSDGGQ